MADDVAGAVANYGDDAANAIGKVDEFLPTDGVWRRVNDSLDEFVPYSEFDGKLPVPSFKDKAAQTATKQRILDRRSGLGDNILDSIKIGTNPAARKTVQDVNVNTIYDMFEQPITSIDGVKINDKWFSHPGIDLNKQYHDFMLDLNWNAFDGTFEDYVGNDNAFTKAAMLERIIQGNRSYDAPISLNVNKRPGANTALGRWYRKNHPGEYPYAIGPNQHYDWDVLDNPFMAISSSDRLPF